MASRTSSKRRASRFCSCCFFAFPRYHSRPDFIQRHVFPGSELASIGHIRGSLARATGLSVAGLEEIGHHYVPTLAAWRRAFLAHRDEVRALGFPESFIRMWDYYLAYCQGAFAEKYIGDAQLFLAKAAVTAGRTASRSIAVREKAQRRA